ncbi:MAG: (S)-ureidoglycine aminohydrolase [Chitinophagaceae bacterium]
MEISALTRSMVKKNHALICPDGYVNSSVPGWTNVMVNVIINEKMGASLCQTLITMGKGGRITGLTKDAQIFFYVLEGKCKASISGAEKMVSGGQYVYVPVQNEYLFENPEDGTQILSFHKRYEKLDLYDVPAVIFGDASAIEGVTYLDDPNLRLQLLLPGHLSFDMAVNIFTYDPGGHLPFVETHIMEHGLMYLQGQGIYRLDNDWYPVKKGDCIWMAPYCPQWFTAMGKEPAVYIYYKNVNRFPTWV